MAEPRRAAKAGRGTLKGARILIVEARFYDHIADRLLAGAVQAIEQAGAAFDRITVPGSLEIPAAIAMALEGAERRGRPYDGVVALGCVIRGETSHYDIVAGESARALMDLAVARRLPLGNGILTVDTEEQALARSEPSKRNKGSSAAIAALSMVRLKRQLAKDGRR